MSKNYIIVHLQSEFEFVYKSVQVSNLRIFNAFTVSLKCYCIL